MKLYGIKLNKDKYLEKLIIDDAEKSVSIIATKDIDDAYVLETKEKIVKLANVLRDELHEVEVEVFELKIKIKEKLLED